MDLLGIFAILMTFIIFSYQSKIPIMYLFSSLISMASSLYMFNYETVGLETSNGSTFTMFGIIFILIALWQLLIFGREYVR